MTGLAPRSPAVICGVSWRGDGYDVAVGRDTIQRRRFGLGDTQAMIGFLASFGANVVVVVESTNGMLDGRMMAAGLRVWRADPEVLPARPRFGAVQPDDLVMAARDDLSRLTRLARDRGTQTGREDALEAGIVQSRSAMETLAAAGRCIASGDPSVNRVAITFDDGPFPPYTHHVLDTLEREQVRATFFCVGLNVGAYPDVVARIAADGHELGNHTWSHPFLPELSRREFDEQIERTGERIAEAVGAGPPRLFRPPYGSRDDRVARWMGELDLRVVLWDVEPFDWAMPGADVIARRVLDEVRPGSVILLHDGGGDRRQTVHALGAIIDGVRRRGLEFVPVGELAAAPPRSR